MFSGEARDLMKFLNSRVSKAILLCFSGDQEALAGAL